MLANYGILTQTPTEVEPVQIWPPGELVKVLTSSEFRRRGNYTNKLVHILENVNYATPFSDWDEGDHSIEEYR